MYILSMTATKEEKLKNCVLDIDAHAGTGGWGSNLCQTFHANAHIHTNSASDHMLLLKLFCVL